MFKNSLYIFPFPPENDCYSQFSIHLSDSILPTQCYYPPTGGEWSICDREYWSVMIIMWHIIWILMWYNYNSNYNWVEMRLISEIEINNSFSYPALFLKSEVVLNKAFENYYDFMTIRHILVKVINKCSFVIISLMF